MSIKISGTGYYVPEKILTNDDLAKMVDTSDEWIFQRVGIKKRHISETETTADMAVKASKAAIENAGINASELDLIIVATITTDTVCPSTAAIVQKEIGALCPAFDINSACSGFLFALDTAAAYVARGGTKKVLVVGSERMSKSVDWSDRATCVIFGDGAGAVVLEKGENYLASTVSTEGGDSVLRVPGFIGTSPFYKGEPETHKIIMDGQETFKFAVRKIVSDVKKITEKAGICVNEIDHFVLHQANIRIIEYAARRLSVDMEKFFVNIQDYGNTSAASVPIALAQLSESGKIKKGDTVVLSAFGGGLSSAACIIKW